MGDGRVHIHFMSGGASELFLFTATSDHLQFASAMSISVDVGPYPPAAATFSRW
jgi:hypothetical protein